MRGLRVCSLVVSFFPHHTAPFFSATKKDAIAPFSHCRRSSFVAFLSHFGARRLPLLWVVSAVFFPFPFSWSSFFLPTKKKKEEEKTRILRRRQGQRRPIRWRQSLSSSYCKVPFITLTWAHWFLGSARVCMWLPLHRLSLFLCRGKKTEKNQGSRSCCGHVSMGAHTRHPKGAKERAPLLLVAAAAPLLL